VGLCCCYSSASHEGQWSGFSSIGCRASSIGPEWERTSNLPVCTRTVANSLFGMQHGLVELGLADVSQCSRPHLWHCGTFWRDHDIMLAIRFRNDIEYRTRICARSLAGGSNDALFMCKRTLTMAVMSLARLKSGTMTSTATQTSRCPAFVFEG
jgi:hypothetical protein